MARTITAAERAAISGRTPQVYGRIEITDSLGVYTDYSTGLLGVDYFDALTLSDDIDANAISPMKSAILKRVGEVLSTPPATLTNQTLEASNMATKEYTPAEKPCSKCRQVKPLTDFYRHPYCKYGRAAQCKACETVQAKAADTRRAAPPVEGVLLGPSQFKRCTRCGVEKPPTEFSPSRKTKTGLTASCADCRKVARTMFRAENLLRLRAQDRGYRTADPERTKARQKKHYQKRKQVNPRFYRKAADASRLRCRAQRRAYSNKWAKEHPKEMYAHTITRRARRKSLTRTAHIPARALQQVLADSLGLCAYCNERKRLQIDHIEPLTRGGLHEMENLAAACKSCNCRKSNTPLLIWLARCAIERELDRAA